MLKVVCLFAVLSVAYAAVAIYPPQEKPPGFEDQDGCYIDTLKMVLPYDEPYYPPNQCTEFYCQSSNNYTQQYTCGVVAVAGDCRIVEDLSKNYPDCCRKFVCDTTTAAPTTAAPTTAAPTTAAPTTAAPTTAAPTTAAPTTAAPTTTTTPSPYNQGSYAYAAAQSGGGQPPATQEYTSGPNADASATAT